MQPSRYAFALDMHTSQSQICLVATQGDTNREFIISLSDGGKPFTVPKESTTVHLLIDRPTGTTIEEITPVISNDGSYVTYKFTQDTCLVDGMHDCQLVFYDEEENELWSPCFSYYVNPKKKQVTT